jgi:hypothetical protein
MDNLELNIRKELSTVQLGKRLGGQKGSCFRFKSKGGS